MESAYKDYINISQCAHLIGVHPVTIRRWIDAGELDHIRQSNKRIYIPISEVIRKQFELNKEILMPEHLVNFNDLHQAQQMDLLSHRIDYLEYLKTRAELVEEVERRKRDLAIAEQALRRVEATQDEREKFYKWPDKYLGLSIKDIPKLAQDKRYQDLIRYQIIEEVNENESD